MNIAISAGRLQPAKRDDQLVRTAGSCVRVLTTTAELRALAEQWDALVERCDDQVFYRNGLLLLWLQSFAADADLRVLTLADSKGRLTAALPLIAVRSRMFGIPVRELRAAGNLHSCRFDLLADDPAMAATSFVEHLRQCSEWDVLCLTDTPADGSAMNMLPAAERAGLVTGCWTSQHSPYCALPGTRLEFELSLNRRLRSNLRRVRRRLQGHGVVTSERFIGGPQLAAKLGEGLALEASGWKGREGTAIQQDPSTLAFYLALAEQAAIEGRLALWFLRVDGKAVAFDFALEHRGSLLVLKTAYDERFADCSPGQLLVEDELHDAVERGWHECDFLGTSSAAKRVWTRLARPHCWVFLFRGPRGHLLRALKFSIVPALKRILAPARTLVSVH